MCAGKSWTAAAASIGAVEALKLKDQGLCRWNSAVRNYGNGHPAARTLSQPNNFSSSVGGDSSEVKREDHKAKQSEESLRTVMYLSCWGPYWFLFNNVVCNIFVEFISSMKSNNDQKFTQFNSEYRIK